MQLYFNFSFFLVYCISFFLIFYFVSVSGDYFSIHLYVWFNLVSWNDGVVQEMTASVWGKMNSGINQQWRVEGQTLRSCDLHLRLCMSVHCHPEMRNRIKVIFNNVFRHFFVLLLFIFVFNPSKSIKMLLRKSTGFQLLRDCS